LFLDSIFFLKDTYIIKHQNLARLVHKLQNIILWQNAIKKTNRSLRENRSKKTRKSHITLHREDNEVMEPGRTSNIHQNELIAKLSFFFFFDNHREYIEKAIK
jgi:hypothetical protein